MALGYLPRETLDALQATAIERGLYVKEEQQNLLAQVPHAVIASIPDAPTPFLVLRNTLSLLNAWVPRPGEPSPLATWLDNAVDALRDHDEAQVFERARAALGKALAGGPAEDPRLPHPPEEVEGGPLSLRAGGEPAGAELNRLYARQDDAEGEARAALEKRIAEAHQALRTGGVLRPGDFLANGRFQLCEVVGRGGFGTVWRARDRLLGDDAAVKVLHAELRDDEDVRRGFFRGARHMARLDHPNIVRIRLASGADELGGHAFIYFIAADYLPGGTLKDAVISGKMGPERAVALIGQIADALQHVHERGIVHCDVSPDNVLLTADRRTAKLSDFDLVAADQTTVTRDAGGKPAFIAPEVARGEKPSAKSDVYALAMTVIFALYGKPLPAADVLRDVRGFVKELPCSEGEARVLLQATRSSSEDRYASVDAFWNAYLAAGLDEGLSARVGAWLRGLPAERRWMLAAAMAAATAGGWAFASGAPGVTSGAGPGGGLAHVTSSSSASSTSSSSSASSTSSSASSSSGSPSTSTSSSSSSSSTSASSTTSSGTTRTRTSTKACNDGICL